MSKYLLIDTTSDNRIVDWQDEARFSYGEPGEGQERMAVSDSEFNRRDDTKIQVFRSGRVEEWILPPSPPPPPPYSVSMQQARRALLRAGLLEGVTAAIAALPGMEGEEAKIIWDYATEVDRDNPLIAMMTSQLGLTDAQLDDLFTLAASL